MSLSVECTLLTSLLHLPSGTAKSSEISFPYLEAAFRISVVNSSTVEKGAPAE